jgi:hypothetical protein
VYDVSILLLLLLLLFFIYFSVPFVLSSSPGVPLSLSSFPFPLSPSPPPFLSPLDTCALKRLTVTHIKRPWQPATPTNGVNAGYVLKYLARYTGAKSVYAPNGDQATALLTDTSSAKLPLVDTRKHYFSDWDGRHDYSILGTPGGDLAEFMIGLRALEESRSLEESLSEEQIMSFLEEFLDERDHFYISCDLRSFRAWSNATGVTNPLTPTIKEQEYVLELAPVYVGSEHIKLMMKNHRDYGVHRLLVERTIRAALRIYYDDAHLHQNKIQFVILRGFSRTEFALVNVLSPFPGSASTSAQVRNPLNKNRAGASGETGAFAFVELGEELIPGWPLLDDEAKLQVQFGALDGHSGTFPWDMSHEATAPQQVSPTSRHLLSTLGVSSSVSALHPEYGFPKRAPLPKPKSLQFYSPRKSRAAAMSRAMPQSAAPNSAASIRQRLHAPAGVLPPPDVPATSPAQACQYYAPMVAPHTPDDGERSVRVYHARAVYEHRATVARFFARAERKDNDKKWSWDFFRLLNKIGNKQLKQSVQALAHDIPTYLAMYDLK